MSELKPCPFCGGKAERTDCIKCGFIQIKCSECDANVTLMLGSPSALQVGEVELIKRWNRRVSNDRAEETEAGR